MQLKLFVLNLYISVLAVLLLRTGTYHCIIYETISECSVGTFGYNCEDSCEGCLLDTCDKRNGTCTDQSGCKPGWQPKLPMCDSGNWNSFFLDLLLLNECAFNSHKPRVYRYSFDIFSHFLFSFDTTPPGYCARTKIGLYHFKCLIHESLYLFSGLADDRPQVIFV